MLAEEKRLRQLIKAQKREFAWLVSERNRLQARTVPILLTPEQEIDGNGGWVMDRGQNRVKVQAQAQAQVRERARAPIGSGFMSGKYKVIEKKKKERERERERQAVRAKQNVTKKAGGVVFSKPNHTLRDSMPGCALNPPQLIARSICLPTITAC